MEHRWGERQSTDVTVRFVKLPGTIGVGRVLNISMTGAYMATKMPLRLLSVVYLELTTPLLAHKKQRRLAASVVRQDRGGVGLEWCESPARSVQIYARLANRSARGVNLRFVPPATLSPPAAIAQGSEIYELTFLS
jgi:hypothetical protein